MKNLKFFEVFKTANFKTVGEACCRLFISSEGSNVIILFFHQFNSHVSKWNKSVQPDQNMMIPELSGIHMNSSFEVSSYFGQTVLLYF